MGIAKRGVLVQICGLPGDGKTTLAAALADAVPAVVLRVDAVEAPLLTRGVPRAVSGIAAYEIVHAIARPHLERGHLVIADAVSPVGAARDGWVTTAAEVGAELRVIEIVLADPAEHRRRVEQRGSDIPGFVLPTWDAVQATAAAYEPRSDPRLIIDASLDLRGSVRTVLDDLGLAAGG